MDFVCISNSGVHTARGNFFCPLLASSLWLCLGVHSSSLNLHYKAAHKHGKTPVSQSDSQEPGSSFIGPTEMFRHCKIYLSMFSEVLCRRINWTVPYSWCAVWPASYPQWAFNPIAATKSNCRSSMPKHVPTASGVNAFLEKVQLKCQSNLNAYGCIFFFLIY